MMKTSVYSVIMTENLERETDFFKEVLGFEETFTSEWYVSLQSDQFELAIIDRHHETIPETHRKKCAGLIINIEYDDVKPIYERIIKEESNRIVKDLCDEDFGQRHFIIESPSGILVDLIQVIPPSEAFIANYKDSQARDEGK